MDIDDNIDLSGASIDVLHALFFRGPLVDGDLPSKSGAAALVDLGLATKSKIAAKRDSVDHFTFLTGAGQAYAIIFLVESDFGKQKANISNSITITVHVDVSPAIEELKAAQLALENIFNTRCC